MASRYLLGSTTGSCRSAEFSVLVFDVVVIVVLVAVADRAVIEFEMSGVL